MPSNTWPAEGRAECRKSANAKLDHVFLPGKDLDPVVPRRRNNVFRNIGSGKIYNTVCNVQGYRVNCGLLCNLSPQRESLSTGLTEMALD